MTHLGTVHGRNHDEVVQNDDQQEEKSKRDERYFNRLWQDRQKLLAKLLHAMARKLNFEVEQLEIFEGGYTPQGWADVELELYPKVGDAMN